MRDSWKKEALKTIFPLLIGILLIISTLSAASANIADVKLLSADIAVTQNVVAGKFKLQNPTGTGDMTKLSLLEMSIRKPGGAFLAVFGPQEMCDPTHTENVHRDYMLYDGETFTLSFSTSPLPDGKYEVWCETANDCYAANPTAFKSEGPCKGGIKLATLDLKATTAVPILVPTQPGTTTGTGGAVSVVVTPGAPGITSTLGMGAILWKAAAAGAGLLLLAWFLFNLGLLYLAAPVALVGLFLLIFGLRGGV